MDHFRLLVRSGKELGPYQKKEIKDLCKLAFKEEEGGYPGPSVSDGIHFVGKRGLGLLISHCMVVDRSFSIGGKGSFTMACPTALATHPDYRGRGYGRMTVMEVCRYCEGAGYDLIMMTTEETRWFESLGWIRWKGPLALDEPKSDLSPFSRPVPMIYRLSKTPPISLRDDLTVVCKGGVAV
nr:GNAT family N-acetyltransferase [uncultured Dethiosulfovibrio sp.]